MDRSGAECPAQRPANAAIRAAIVAESRCAGADSTEHRSDSVEILATVLRELPGVVMDARSTREPDAQPRVHGGLRRTGLQRGGCADHRRADHRVVPQFGRLRASAGPAATYAGRRAGELHYGTDRCVVARAGAAGFEGR